MVLWKLDQHPEVGLFCAPCLFHQSWDPENVDLVDGIFKLQCPLYNEMGPDVFVLDVTHSYYNIVPQFFPIASINLAACTALSQSIEC